MLFPTFLLLLISLGPGVPAVAGASATGVSKSFPAATVIFAVAGVPAVYGVPVVANVPAVAGDPALSVVIKK